MCKFIFCLWLFVLWGGAVAADLTLLDGTIYTQAEVKKCTGGFVYLLHEKGEAKIALEQLPENFIAALNFRQRNALRNGVDIKLADGKLYQHCTVKSMGGNGIVLKHDLGEIFVAFKDLPKSYRATFNRRQLLKIFSSPKNPAPEPAAIIGKTAQGQIVYQGARGGRYYLNSSGRKVYLRKDVEIKSVDGVKANAGQQ